MIYIVALGVGFKCPRKIHLNTQWGRGIFLDSLGENQVGKYTKNISVTLIFGALE